MLLKKYYGKKVCIIAQNEKVFEGMVVEYCYPEDNDPEEESITVRCTKGPFPEKLVEFPASDIKSITVI